MNRIKFETGGYLLTVPTLLSIIILTVANSVQINVQASEATVPIETKASPVYRGEPVSPLQVTADPETLKLTPGSGSPRTVPEGSPHRIGPPPERKPISDPVIQIESDTQSSVVLEEGLDFAAFEDGPTFGLLSNPDINVAGILANVSPPDTVGDIGSGHYVQMTNAGATGGQTTYQIFNKDGTTPATGGPFRFGGLWPTGDPCRSDLGDPIVVYDHLADRWLLSQFARNAGRTRFWMCIAMSQTPDPTSNSWFLYTFEVPAFPDYPKIGVWPDGYYMSDFEGAANALGIFVFERSNMLAGVAARYFRTTIGALSGSVRETRILPADLDGPPPPAGTPNFFVRTVDDQQDAVSPVDRIEVWSATVDWIAATFNFTLANFPSPAAFQTMTCDRSGQGAANNNAFRDCIPQPDTPQNVDALSNRPMMQLKYRNFGSHASMVFNQTIDTSGSIFGLLGFTPANEVAGIRWYELRNDGASGFFAVNQQGTYAAQPIGTDTENALLHRWMGSIAMDKDGNIAMGYSISNDDDTDGQEVYPGLRYAGRLASDPPGIMAQGEKILLSGTNSVLGPNGTTARDGRYRWGDYSAMSVDPVDDCTFWYTNHVAPPTGAGAKPTQIGSFKFTDNCGINLAISKTASPDPATAGEQLIYQITVDNNGPSPATNVIVVDTLPGGVSYISDTDSCTEAPAGILNCDLGDIASGDSVSFEVQVLIDSDLIGGGPNTLTNSAIVSADQADNDESDDEAIVTTLILESADLKVTKDCKPDDPLPAGETATCTIYVDNLGVSTARNVELVDTHISDGIFVLSNIKTSQGVCAQAPAGIITCDLGNIGTGERVTVTVNVTSDEGANVNDEATVRSLTPDPDTTNNQDEDSVTFLAKADLQLTKSDDPDSVVAGEQLTYTLTVENLGPSNAVNVLVTDVLPTGVSVVSVSGTSGATCNAGVPGDASQPTTCAFDSLVAGATAETMTIVVTVLPDTIGILHNDASVTADTADSNNINNLATEDTTVVAVTGLTVSKSDDLDPVSAGSELKYTITVTNNGPSIATMVDLVDTLPVEVDLLSAEVQEGTGICVQSASGPDVVTCTLDPLDPGNMFTVVLTGLVNASVPDGTTISNHAEVFENGIPTADVSETTEVVAIADIWIDKTSNFPTGNASGTILYFLTVHNTSGCSEDDPQVCGDGGPSDAQNIVVTDTLPSTYKKLIKEFVSENCSYDKGSHTVTCNEPVLTAGSSVTFEIQVTAKGNLGQITNKVDVTTTTTDPDLTNNHDELLMTVKGGTGDSGGPGGGRGRGGGPKK